MSDYHKLSIDEKRRQNLSSVRDSAVTCPICDTQVMPIDLPVHIVQRCTGPRTPSAGSMWATFREALAFGVPKRTLARWVSEERVRVKGLRGEQRYLVRDLALLIARQKLRRRR